MYDTFQAFRPHFNTLARVGYFKIVSGKPNKFHNYYRIFVWFCVLTYNLQHIIRAVQASIIINNETFNNKKNLTNCFHWWDIPFWRNSLPQSGHNWQWPCCPLQVGWFNCRESILTGIPIIQITYIIIFVHKNICQPVTYKTDFELPKVTYIRNTTIYLSKNIIFRPETALNNSLELCISCWQLWIRLGSSYLLMYE